MPDFLKSTNKNLFYSIINGIYKGIGVRIGDGNCYGNRFRGYYAGKVIRKKIILDVVPTTLQDHYIALTYNSKVL